MALAGAVVVALAGLAVTAVLLSGGQSFRDGFAGRLAEVSRENQRLSREFRALDRDAPASQVAPLAAEARVRLDAVNERLAGLEPSGSDVDPLADAMAAVAAESAWLREVQREGIRPASDRRALDRINAQLTGVRPAVTPIDVGAVVD